jgi:hypothetical protein
LKYTQDLMITQVYLSMEPFKNNVIEAIFCMKFKKPLL